VLYSTYYYYYYYYYTFEKHNNYIILLINLIVCRERPSNTETMLRKYRDKTTEIQKQVYVKTEMKLRKYRNEATEIWRGGYGNTETRLLAEERKSYCSIPGKGPDFLLLQRIQIGSGDHRVSYAMCNAAEA